MEIGQKVTPCIIRYKVPAGFTALLHDALHNIQCYMKDEQNAIKLIGSESIRTYDGKGKLYISIAA